jgi:uncharacterized membrane protein
VLFFIPEDGDIMFLRNVGIYLRVHMASQQEQHRHIHRRVNLKSHVLKFITRWIVISMVSFGFFLMYDGSALSH